MALVKTEITKQAQHKVYARFDVEYTFGDGQVIRRKSTRVPTLADIPAKVLAMQSSAESQARRSAAGRITSIAGPIASEGEATAQDVLTRYIQELYFESELLIAFKLFRRVRQYVQAQNLTWIQVRDLTELKLKEWQQLKERIDYFVDNYSAINAFLTVSNQDPGAR